MMGPPSGHLFYSRGMTVLKPPIGIPANSAGNAGISEQRRARWQAMAVPQRASGVSGPLRQYLPRQDGREEQQRGSGVSDHA